MRDRSEGRKSRHKIRNKTFVTVSQRMCVPILFIIIRKKMDSEEYATVVSVKV
jgi:hypothetical protein